MTAPAPIAADARREEVALLPCPFCGCDAYVREADGDAHNAGSVWIQCGMCEVRGADFQWEDNAASAWNTRAALTPPAALDVLRQGETLIPLEETARDLLDAQGRDERTVGYRYDLWERLRITLAQLCERASPGEGESEESGYVISALPALSVPPAVLPSREVERLRAELQRVYETNSLNASLLRAAEARLAEMEGALATIQSEARREDVRLVHLKRCIAAQCALLATIAKGEGTSSRDRCVMCGRHGTIRCPTCPDLATKETGRG